MEKTLAFSDVNSSPQCDNQLLVFVLFEQLSLLIEDELIFKLEIILDVRKLN
jgi:hypothetical protein